MNTFWEALVDQSFLQYAVVAGLLAGIGCGIMGTFVVIKRITFLAGGIAHTVLGGMGIAYFLGQAPMAGALVAALVAALLIGWVKLNMNEKEDTLIGALWAIGMALGIIFISRTPGYNVDLMSFLFGSILMVGPRDLWLMGAVDLVVGVVVLLWYKQFLAICFDPEFAQLRGVRVTFFYLLLLCLVAITVVLLIHVVGLILVIALLTLPAAIASQYVTSVGRIILVAAGLGMAFTFCGLAVSYQPDLPAGATIILVAGVAYVASSIGTSMWRRVN